MPLAAVALLSAGLCNFNTLLNVRATVCKDFVLAHMLSVKLC